MIFQEKGTMLIKKRLLTPGPTQLPERVRFAMARDMMHHRKPEFCAIARECGEKLRIAFGTEQPVLTLAASGTGAMVAAVTNLFAPGEEVIVLQAGKFAERWTKIAESRNLTVHAVSIPWGEAASPERLRAALAEHPGAKGVLVQLSETSTGVMHPIRELAEIVRNTDALMVVDGISGVLIAPCPMDEWGIDCLVTGSQKGVMLPPGLSFIALSERAWKKAETVTPGCFYFNLTKERAQQALGQTCFTPPVSLIVGLKESLDMFWEFGLENVYRKQWALAAMARAGLSAMGLRLFARTHFAWGLTSALAPEGMDAGKIIGHAAKEYGVILAGGQDHMKGVMIRMAHMGWVDWADVMSGLVALSQAIVANGGVLADKHFMDPALRAYHDALQHYDPSASTR